MNASEADERATATWLGEFKVDVSIRDKFTLRADEIEKLGGSNTGPMPSELLLASLASCMCMAVSFMARKRGITVEELRVDVAGNHNPDEFRFDRITVRVHSPLNQENLSDLVDRAREYCYVSNTLEGGCELEYETHGDVELEAGGSS